MAKRNLDRNQVAFARAVIISLERASQPPCFNPHNRIRAWIEIFSPSESSNGNRIAFERSAFAAQFRFDNKPEECNQMWSYAEALGHQHGL